MHRMLKIEWDAVAGVLAAVIAIVLHLLHVIEAEVLFGDHAGASRRDVPAGRCGPTTASGASRPA